MATPPPPFDPRPPMISSGPRIGTPAPATRGFGAEELREVADIVAEAPKGERPDGELRDRVEKPAAAFPRHPHPNGAAA